MNSTFDSDNSDQFLRCWGQPDCSSCLSKLSGCSWCPFTATCLPNPYAIPMLAPAFDEHICPYAHERWEIRTRPLGCQVSTITSLTSVVSIASTLFVVLLIYLLVLAFRGLRNLNRKQPGWWKVWRYNWQPWTWRWTFWRDRTGTAAEQEPLLAP